MLGWDDRHDTSTPNRPQTNGIIEHCVRLVKEGLWSVLLQSGLAPEWWADAMRYFCFQHNIEDRLSDGKTPYARRFKKKFPHRIYPFGYEVDYKPSSPKVLNQMHPFGGKRLKGIFMGYYLDEGGYHHGDVFVADWVDFANAERVREIVLRRLNSKEVDLSYDPKGIIRFPIAEGKLNQPATLINSTRQRAIVSAIVLRSKRSSQMKTLRQTVRLN